MLRKVFSKLKVATIHFLLVLIIGLFVAVPFFSELKNKVASSELLLNMYRSSLESEISRYKFLPFILSQNDKINKMLSGEFDPVSSGYFLQRIKYATNVSTIYVLDKNGRAVASSNWHDPESYTGKNFGFRPYFKEAMAGRLGQFYGIGIVSSTPGFFLAYGLKSDDTIIGAVAIEIHLTDLETVWRSGPDDILVSDVNDVIFLSSNESWKHKSFGKSGASIDDNPAALDRFNNGVTNPIAQKICYRIGDITFYKNPLFSCIFPEKLSLKEEIVEFGWTIHSIQSARYIYNSVALIVSISVLLYLTLIFLYRNITNKYNRSIQKIRNQLLENSKLAAIGQMATEVAHEFNQPLSAIYMLLDTSRLLLKRKRYHDVDDNLVLISSHIEKLTQQISELKGFASRHRVPRGKANIVSAANASIRLFQLTLKKHNVKLFLQVRHDDIQVPCNEIGLEQIFSNLITNALEAMGDQSDKVIVIMIVRVKGRVIVKVRDNGCGIPDPTKIFESFYSTKQRGTGLGLAIVNGIVENSDGTISVRNHPKGGAEFTVSWSEWREEQADSTETPN